MNILPRHRWILFVAKYSKTRIWPYTCLILTALLVALEFTKYAHFHFLLVMVVLTVMAYERLAFTELLAQRDKEIEALKSKKGAGAT